jgi:4-hydroxybenzoate polyprenyltransferase
MNYYTRMIAMLVVSMAISMALTWYFGLFVGLAMSFAIFILISMYIRKKRIGNPTGMFGGGVNYICIACGHKFKGGTCPRCGSKMRRAEF